MKKPATAKIVIMSIKEAEELFIFLILFTLEKKRN